jgi:predicted Zn-dependent protease
VIIGVPQDVGNGIGKNESGDLYHSGEFFELRGFSGEASRCELRTSTTGDTSMLWASLYHGLGHCLGLGHDDFALSIMRPLQVYDGKSMPWITDRDRSAIRNRYAMD